MPVERLATWLARLDDDDDAAPGRGGRPAREDRNRPGPHPERDEKSFSGTGDDQEAEARLSPAASWAR